MKCTFHNDTAALYACAQCRDNLCAVCKPGHRFRCGCELTRIIPTEASVPEKQRKVERVLIRIATGIGITHLIVYIMVK